MVKPNSTPSPRTATQEPKKRRTAGDMLREPSTWAGIFSICAAFATGGVSVLANPATLSSIGAGLALILTKEGK